MTCPCNLCEVRFVGCHAECEVYKTWKAEVAEQKERNGTAKNILMNEFKWIEDLRWKKRRRGHR